MESIVLSPDIKTIWISTLLSLIGKISWVNWWAKYSSKLCQETDVSSVTYGKTFCGLTWRIWFPSNLTKRENSLKALSLSFHYPPPVFNLLFPPVLFPFLLSPLIFPLLHNSFVSRFHLLLPSSFNHEHLFHLFVSLFNFLTQFFFSLVFSFSSDIISFIFLFPFLF